MTAFVLDASIAVRWCIDSQKTADSEAALQALADGQALVPSVFPLEVLHALLRAERELGLAEVKIRSFLDDLLLLPIEVRDHELSTVLGRIQPLARKLGISSYDASYLELAQRLRFPLATADESLEKAARKAGIPLFEVAR
jgi:predicted nucleic acid-binding protein